MSMTADEVEDYRARALGAWARHCNRIGAPVTQVDVQVYPHLRAVEVRSLDKLARLYIVRGGRLF